MLATLLMLVIGWQEPILLDRPLPAYLSGPEFRTAIQQPFTATWTNVELRSLLRRTSETRQVSILLDRRVDPTVTIEFSLNGIPLLEGLEQLAARLEQQVSVPGSTIYLGPPVSARWLRTTIEQREVELMGSSSTIPEPRQVRLLARKTIHWQDLESPRQILQQIAGRYELRIDGLSEVPHDLWASGTLPYATAAESLTIVLAQLDLDFRWSTAGDAIMLVPWSQPELIERRYRPRPKVTAAATLEKWQAEFPELQGSVVEEQVRVVGRVEDHDRVARLLRPDARSTQPAEANAVPLRRRQFTLRVQNVPIQAIMRELEKSGIQFQWDQEKLRAAQVDLGTLVSLDAKGASADEFLELVFAPVKVRVSIDDRTVTLEPAGE